MAPVNDILEHSATAGFVLSTEHRAALASSLIVLKKNEKFDHVQFWGKIAGTASDYYVCQGVGSAALTDRKSFYSTDCLNWAQLPAVHPVIAGSAMRLKSRFTGSASNEFTVTEPGPAAADAPEDLPEDVKALRSVEQIEEGSTITTKISEDKRLAVVVSAIDNECSTVPYGAYVKTANGFIEANISFSGLSSENAGKLASYQHFRVPRIAATPLERSAKNKTLDIFDPLTADVPNGCWTLNMSASAEAVHLKNLLWPGFTFFHIPGTNRFGQVYNGTAVRNSDLVFML